MANRVDEIIRLLVSEALDIERKGVLDFVGALNNVQLSVSAKVGRIMEAKRAAERLEKEKKNVRW